MGGFDDVFCLGDFRSRPVGDQQELIRLERCLVLHNAVLRNDEGGPIPRDRLHVPLVDDSTRALRIRQESSVGKPIKHVSCGYPFWPRTHIGVRNCFRAFVA